MKDDRAYLLHIQDAAACILSYTADGQAAFVADRRTQDAAVRNLEIIGEAAKNLSSGRPWSSCLHDAFELSNAGPGTAQRHGLVRGFAKPHNRS